MCNCGTIGCIILPVQLSCSQVYKNLDPNLCSPVLHCQYPFTTNILINDSLPSSTMFFLKTSVLFTLLATTFAAPLVALPRDVPIETCTAVSTGNLVTGM